MKKLTKTAIVVTLLSAITLGLTSQVTQSLVAADSKHPYPYDVITWHIPFYKTLDFKDEAWWTFIRIWLVSLILPPLIWVVVGIRTLLAKMRPR